MLQALGLMAIVVVPVFVLTAIMVLRYRRGRKATYRPDWGFSWPLDIAIWTVPALIVIMIGFLLWTRTHRLDPYLQAGPGEVLEIEAIALDWKWVFLYPQAGVATVNSLVIPADRPVRVALTSDTVLNGFFIPGLAGQIMAMAGMRTELNLRADAPALMWGKNTQYDGNGFPAHEFEVRVVDAAGFDAWTRQAQGAPKPLGAALYRTLSGQQATSPVETFSGFDRAIFADTIAKYRPEMMAGPGMEGMR